MPLEQLQLIADSTMKLPECRVVLNSIKQMYVSNTTQENRHLLYLKSINVLFSFNINLSCCVQLNNNSIAYQMLETYY